MGRTQACLRTLLFAFPAPVLSEWNSLLSSCLSLHFPAGVLFDEENTVCRTGRSLRLIAVDIADRAVADSFPFSLDA